MQDTLHMFNNFITLRLHMKARQKTPKLWPAFIKQFKRARVLVNHYFTSRPVAPYIWHFWSSGTIYLHVVLSITFPCVLPSPFLFAKITKLIRCVCDRTTGKAFNFPFWLDALHTSDQQVATFSDVVVSGSWSAHLGSPKKIRTQSARSILSGTAKIWMNLIWSKSFEILSPV